MIRFCTFLIVVNLTSAYYGEYIKQKIPDGIETLNVTACSGKVQYDLSVYEEPLTWHKALKSCMDKGFNSLEDSKSNSLRRDHIREYLQELRNKGTNTSHVFWTGLFRTEPTSNVWFKSIDTGNCIEFNGSDILKGEIRPDYLCSFVEFDFTGDTQVLRGAFCNQSFPYICHNHLGEMVLHSYSGFSHIFSTLPDHATEELRYNISNTSCFEECMSDKICNAFTYNYTANLCTILKSSFKFGATVYTIVRSQESVSHFAKAECNVSYHDKQFDSQHSEVPEEFPICYPVMDQCTCNISNVITEENIAIAQELIQNLTVDPTTISAYLRSLTSAPDDRTSSKLLGTLATLSMIGVFSIFLILDILKCIYHIKRVIRDIQPDSHENPIEIKLKQIENKENVQLKHKCPKTV